MVILELIHAKSPTHEGLYLLDQKPMPSGSLVIHNNFADRMALR